ncbi:MAG: acyl carrier protein [bacterium]
MELEQELKKVFSHTFSVLQEKISVETRQFELQEWDSLGQLRLIMEIEEAFSVSFLMEEIASLDSFDKILENIKLKIKNNISM